MFQYDEGIGMARSVIEINQKTPIIGRGYLALGIGCCCKASTGKLYIVLCTVGWGNQFIFNTLYVSHIGYDFINNIYDTVLPRNNLIYAGPFVAIFNKEIFIQIQSVIHSIKLYSFNSIFHTHSIQYFDIKCSFNLIM